MRITVNSKVFSVHVKNGRYYCSKSLPNGKRVWISMSRVSDGEKALEAALSRSLTQPLTERGSKKRIRAIEILKRRFISAKNRSTRIGREFTITFDDIVAKFDANFGTCPLTGISLDPSRKPFTPSIDRTDSSKGYTADNVRIVCLAMNIALNEWGMEVFGAMVNGFKKLKHSDRNTPNPKRKIANQFHAIPKTVEQTQIEKSRNYLI